MQRSAVLIYNSDLLPPSQTFVREQAEALRAFVPFYVGLHRVAGLDLPEQRTVLVSRGGARGRLQELVYLLINIAPDFYRRIQRVGPVLLHAHFGTGGTDALPLGRRLRLPLVVTYHGFDATVTDDALRRSSGGRLYLLRRAALKRDARLFIAVSEFIRGKLLAQGFPRDRVIVHHIGVNTEYFQPDDTVEREPVVLFVGRLVEKKGCEHLIRAMAHVEAALPEARLVIIGDGRLRSALERAAASTLRNYAFLGLQPPESIRAWMNRSALLCLPSIVATSGDAEGFGMVALEAQAMGLPVVGFASGGIPEAVAHGETGLLAEEKNSDELAAAILRLLNDTHLWTTFSQQARRRTVERFNLRQQTHKLEEIYAGVAMAAR